MRNETKQNKNVLNAIQIRCVQFAIIKASHPITWKFVICVFDDFLKKLRFFLCLNGSTNINSINMLSLLVRTYCVRFFICFMSFSYKFVNTFRCFPSRALVFNSMCAIKDKKTATVVTIFSHQIVSFKMRAVAVCIPLFLFSSPEFFVQFSATSMKLYCTRKEKDKKRDTIETNKKDITIISLSLSLVQYIYV